MRKTIKKLACTALAAISVFGCAATLTACETSHPEVEMKLEFNGKTYTLDYKLYRKIAPATVDHFLWLADNDYYNGLCIHDYDEDGYRMYTGGYSATDATTLVYKRYYDTISTYSNYAKFPVSVWADRAATTPTYTLRGEFEDNNFVVTNGALEESFGSLSMFYYDISSYESVAQSDVYIHDDGNKGEIIGNEYQFNQTTSLFYISLTPTAKQNASYCTFATLDKDSKSTLEDLQAAIEEYAGDEDFTQSVSMDILEDDKKIGHSPREERFDVPKSAIVIKQVKVTKY